MTKRTPTRNESKADYPKSGQKFIVAGETYKWVPYHKTVRDRYGAGRFKRMRRSGPNEDGDFFKWVNEAPPSNQSWYPAKKKCRV